MGLFLQVEKRGSERRGGWPGATQHVRARTGTSLSPSVSASRPWDVGLDGREGDWLRLSPGCPLLPETTGEERPRPECVMWAVLTHSVAWAVGLF